MIVWHIKRNGISIEEIENEETYPGGSLSLSFGGVEESYSINQLFPSITGGCLLLSSYSENIVADSTYTTTPYVITFDNVRVNGKTKVYNTGNNGSGQCTGASFHEVT